MDQRIVLLGVGNTIAVAAGTEETGGAFALLDYELAPGFAALPPHTHQREDAAIYVLEGRLLVRVSQTERLVEQGEFIFLPKEVAHALSNPGSQPARFLTVLIPAGFECCFRDLEAVLDQGASFSAEAVGPLLACYGVQVEKAGAYFTGPVK